MSTLQNFLAVSQLADATEANREFDCVPSSIAAGLGYLTGQKYSGAQIKDAVYGAGYRGGTAAVMYVEYCAKQGVKLSSISGNASYLASQAHAQLALGHPVIYTEPDPYDSAPGMTHVCVMCGETPNSFLIMDPFGGKFLTISETDMMARFQFNQIWIMQKSGGNTVAVPQGWSDDGKTLTAPNGVPVALGFRMYVLGHDWNPQNYPLTPEYSISQLEMSNPALGDGSQQMFRFSMLGWVKATNVVVEESVGTELMATRIRAANLYSQLVLTEKNTGTQYAQTIAQLNAALQSAQTELAKTKADYDALSSGLANIASVLQKIAPPASSGPFVAPPAA